MATERLISPAQSPEEESANWALRPRSLDEYVGQHELVERILIAVEAVQARTKARQDGSREHLEHVLLHGPPGLGKTTIAHVIGAELGTRVHTTSGPALARGTDLVAVLTRLQPGDVLFIDEIHRLPVAVEEFIYPAMEDFRIDVCLDTGLNARTVQINCAPFTLIGATTRAGLLSSPLRSRFGITHHLRYYDTPELVRILARSCAMLGVTDAQPDALERIADRSRGTPRIANRLLRRVRDFADVRAGGRVSAAIVDEALRLEGVDELGLDNLDRAYLKTIAEIYRGGPVGLEAVAATMNEDAGTLEDVVEPYLLQIGFLARTRRGRTLTARACERLGISPPADPEQPQMF
ncbi:MAG: Holliday junction branch migration DNA helicase RuvB [Phycisphaerales bacterium]|nr:Holliday junction branch migration DNA helicase RuvB [Planctomycetota bacterium]MCH8508739.1 Holliday junction branch migration DNA helicase RuvB [Phycisphaerales bacterium]